jgi:hypothetical protein
LVQVELATQQEMVVQVQILQLVHWLVPLVEAVVVKVHLPDYLEDRVEAAVHRAEQVAQLLLAKVMQVEQETQFHIMAAAAAEVLVL